MSDCHSGCPKSAVRHTEVGASLRRKIRDGNDLLCIAIWWWPQQTAFTTENAQCDPHGQGKYEPAKNVGIGFPSATDPIS